MASDEELMLAYLSGQDDAFRGLFGRYAPLIFNLMRQQGRSVEDAEDIVQQTFLHVHRARRDFRQGSRFKPWLMAIAFNVMRELRRKRRRKPEAPLQAAGPLPTDPEDLEAKEEAEQVRAAILRLAEDQRQVILLHWFADMGFKEIAKVVGASLSAVKVRAHRGYNALRQLLNDSGNQAAP